MQPLPIFESKKLLRIQWLAPVVMVAVVVLYEYGPSSWVLSHYGHRQHIVVDSIFFGLTGPILAYYLLKFIINWLEERETSELQARILEESQAQVGKFRDSADTALQSLFASSILIQSLSSKMEGLTPEEAGQLQKAQMAIDVAIRDLRRQLESSSPPPKVVNRQPPARNGQPEENKPLSAELQHRSS